MDKLKALETGLNNQPGKRLWLQLLSMFTLTVAFLVSKPVLGQAGLGNAEQFLPPEEAFPFLLEATADVFRLDFDLPEGYYLYRERFQFESLTEDVVLGEARIPDGQMYTDRYFGEMEIYRNNFAINIPYQNSVGKPGAELLVVFQGCADAGLCYNPQGWERRVALPAGGGQTPLSVVASSSSSSNERRSAAPVSEQDQLANVILGGSLWTVLATFYGAGLLLAFTPCVLPMVPILSSIIGAQGPSVTTGRAFSLSLTYVMGMAVTYTGAGALAALAGEQIQAIFQQPWIISLFAGLFVVLALSMFGLYEIQVPSAIQSRMGALANRQKKGTYIGTAAMGALSALIVTSCVAPPLVATLAVIGQSGDVARGAGALFIMSLGMGSPLLLVGASGGKLLPKAGPWMNAVKAGFGIMMLGLAIWMMERVLPDGVILVLWAVLVFLTGVFLGAFDTLPEAATKLKRFSKGLGSLACLYGAMMLIGAIMGGDDPLQPIPQNALVGNAVRADGETAGGQLPFEPVDSVAELEALLAQAKADGMPVMLDFTADWCVSCKEMEEDTFPDSGVHEALEPYRLLQADVTENDEADKAMLNYFGIFGPPTIAFFDGQGRELKPFRLVGFVPPEEFSVHVRQATEYQL